MAEGPLASLLPAFVEDAVGLLERIDAAIAAMARALAQGAPEEPARAQARSDLHTLRGNATMMRQKGIVAVVRAMESALDPAGEPPARAAAAVDLLRAGKALLDKLVSEALDPPPPDGSVEAFVARASARALGAEPREPAARG